MDLLANGGAPALAVIVAAIVALIGAAFFRSRPRAHDVAAHLKADADESGSGAKRTELLLSDISRSDLNGIQRTLERIADKLSYNPGSDLNAVVNRLNDIKSLLQDISRKLDQR